MTAPAGRKPSTALFEDGTYSWDEFRKVFFETKDIYEYRAAIKLVGTWEEWQRLKRDSPTFRRTVELWVDELKAMLRSDAFCNIVSMTDTKGAQALAAAKWLIEETTEKPSGKRKPGRPSKQAVAKAAREVAQEERDTRDELERIQQTAVLSGD